jgi:hypothetical protein
MERRNASSVVASIEDFIHHFRVTLDHDHERVTDIRGEAVRAPWSVCPGATARLGEFLGASLDRPPRPTDATEHCTHLLDLAVVAVRYAGGVVQSRRIDLEVTGWDGPEIAATARRDDGLTLQWSVRNWTIVDPEPYTGRGLGGGFGSWAATDLNEDEGELALLLRRATLMSPSRGIDLDEFDRLSESRVIRGSCFASRPERIGIARRNRGSSLPRLE